MRLGSDEEIPGRAALSVGNVGPPPPEGWTRTRLTDVARLESGHTPSRRHPEYWNGDVPWVGIKDARLHDGREIHRTLQTVTELGLANSAARWLPAGTVCLSRTASVGYVVILGRPMATSQDFVNWVCSPALDNRFLKYALAAEGDHLREFGKGTTHTTIYFPEVLAFHICLPPLAEQHRIVDTVEALLADVKAARARLAKVPGILNRLRQSVLAAACSGGRLTHPADDEWKEKRLGDLCREITVGHVGPMVNEYVGRGIPFLRSQNVREFRIDSANVRYISRDFHARLKKSSLSPGDVVIVRSGNAGVAAVIPASLSEANCADLVILRPGAGVDPRYLAVHLNSNAGRAHVEDVKVGIAQGHFNIGSARSMPIRVPALTTQRAIVERVEVLFAVAAEIEQRVQSAMSRSESLTAAILAKAFRGELVPTEAELARTERRAYESAEALLARTQAGFVATALPAKVPRRRARRPGARP